VCIASLWLSWESWELKRWYVSWCGHAKCVLCVDVPSLNLANWFRMEFVTRVIPRRIIAEYSEIRERIKSIRMKVSICLSISFGRDINSSLSVRSVQADARIWNVHQISASDNYAWKNDVTVGRKTRHERARNKRGKWNAIRPSFGHNIDCDLDQRDLGDYPRGWERGR